MPENQQEIDALLAEVNALAEEAVADIVGGDADGLVSPPPGAPPASADPQSAPPAPAQTAESPAINEDLTRILHIEVPVIVRLAQNTMPLSDITGLTTGAIVEFDKPSDGELELMINNKCIGQGQAVKVGENFGLRITQIGSVRDRIAALGRK